MKQFNINVTKDFQRDLEEYMKKMNISQKSEAIRSALHEVVMRFSPHRKKTDFYSWIGLALKAPLNPHPRFKTDDDLWEDNKS